MNISELIEMDEVINIFAKDDIFEIEHSKRNVMLA